MTMSAFLMFLVYSTFSSPITMNRLGTLMIMFTLIIYLNSINIMGLTPGITLFNNWFSLTGYNIPLTMLMLMLSVMLLMYSTSTHRYDLKSPYYYLMMLANMMGLLLFPLVNDLMALYIVVELQSYSLYLLTGLHNRSYNASRASLLYFLMGGMASTMMLLASYFMYSLTGSTNLSDMSMFYSTAPSTGSWLSYAAPNNAYDYFDMLLFALLFKMGMAPLHRWSMAVYNYAPTYMTAYMSVVAKMSIASWMFSNAYLFNHHLLMLFFYMSLAVAAYKPLFQVNMKTMLAYSGLLNFGYILLTMMSFDMSFYVYMIQYVLTHMMLFLGMLAASQYMKTPMTKWSPLLYMHQLKMPNLTLVFMLVMALFSLMGMPPTPGFYAKLYVLAGALQDNYVLEVCAMVLFSVMATYYYANIIKMLISSVNMVKNNENINTINPSLAYLLSVSTVMLMSLFIYLPSLLEGLYLMTM
uniref:NADH-ubiquinone oxidoreductase chain 2 n=1 Tax=Millerozyma farinosa TaxID=4920 RepID=E3PQS5_MILFA|nr:NADH dehydrogenase subunit 2 [Millerozyma farinosa]